MLIKSGDSVGAIFGIEGNTVFLFGYGAYAGTDINTRDGVITSNPVIALDNGKILKDIECIWGDIDKILDLIGSKSIIFVDPDEIKKMAEMRSSISPVN